ncbi:hypothetical protein NON00_23400 [Roseomonas sp. GC11]|uniref:hypothetical protein n=1 Tax=Roseomonas sp. GC11 TaxID=2950546 RepID=UPI00210C2384|nr:hypothetical protein [Roseomonas sp. GC11]MCQ4162852.1 hypothetical protein [Roseomonas sp. GC11]
MDKSRIQTGAQLRAPGGREIGQVQGVEGDFLALRQPDGATAYLPLSALAESEGPHLTTLLPFDAVTSLLQERPEPGESGSNAVASS